MRHGELQTDLDLLEVAEWLALIQFILVAGWTSRGPTIPAIASF